MVLAPLPFILPLVVAAALAGVSFVTPRWLVDAVSTATAAAVAIICAVLLARSAAAPIVYAFGGWRPRGGIVLGVFFVIDPLGAGFATLVAALVTAELVFSWRYFEEVKSLFHVLMLVFLGGMAGFCLTGDLFNLFVCFELMGVAAFALTGYKVEERGPLQGALNFAITNSVGAFLILTGIALLYGHTGALNLAQIGRALAGRPAGGLVIVAFVLLTTGLFVKAAVVPFHFWIADAHAVAPTPVCILFSGVMVELALYTVARIYWTVFAGTLGAHSGALRAILVAFGVLTAVVGAVMCLAQRHLKRLLAFSTVAHVGLFLIGTAMLTPLGLAGGATYILGHALVKGALFLCAGILLHRFETVDISHLRGRGHALPFTGAIFAIAGLGLAGLPPFGTFLGKGQIEDAVTAAGYGWVTVVLVLASMATGGAVLRAGAEVFLGWGWPAEDPAAANEGDERESESGGPSGRTPPVMFAPALVLVVAGLLVGVLPGLGQAIAVAAARFEDQPAYIAAVLPAVTHAARHVGARAVLAPGGASLASVISGLVSAAGAVAYALIAVNARGIPTGLRAAGARLAGPPVRRLRSLQSGHPGDFVAWLMLGVAGFLL
jgi:multicomponent Na+:H+ antiporter subunit D